MIPQHRYAHEPTPAVWWVACHGGAGTSTLARLCGLGVDAGRAWPAPPKPHERPPLVVLVCRMTADGTWAATAAVRQWRQKADELATRNAIPPQLLGVAAVAASPRRPPKLAADRLRMLAGWVPAIWRIGWVDALLGTDEPLSIGIPPDVDALRHTILAAIDGTTK